MSEITIEQLKSGLVKFILQDYFENIIFSDYTLTEIETNLQNVLNENLNFETKILSMKILPNGSLNGEILIPKHNIVTYNIESNQVIIN